MSPAHLPRASPLAIFPVALRPTEGISYGGEEEAKVMAERPDPSPDVPMSSADLAEVRRSFSMFSTDGLRSAYADALERCKLDKRGRPPRCEHIQALVQAWRVLRKQHGS
jgi:hypothetical protein